MSLRAYLIVMGLATVLATATFFLVLFRVDPTDAGALGFTLFYTSLFMSVVGVLSLFGFVARVILHRNEMLSRLVSLAFRQAVLFGVLTVVALYLRSRHLLSWWNSLLLILVLSLVEFVFISIQHHPHRQVPPPENP